MRDYFRCFCRRLWTAEACCRLWQCSLLRASGIGTAKLARSQSSAVAAGCFTESGSRLPQSKVCDSLLNPNNRASAEILWPHCSIFPSKALHQTAIRLHRETQYRFYDCLIVAAALESGASILYSEDLQNGRSFGEMKIINPFVEC